MNPNVLIVDDSPSVRMDLQQALSGAGFSVTACENGATARRALRTGSFALLILDIKLPDADGLEIAQEARAYPPTAKAPIIMLSAEAEVQHRIRSLTSGASEFIGKPYGAQYVIKRARQLTDMRGAASSASNTSTGPLRILLVDDSPTFLNALAERLRVEGHDVILSKSGSEALSFLAVQPVDGIVLDVFMPGIGGIETCRRIKCTPAWADIPIMMLTGREDSVAKATGLRAGVDDYVVKSADVMAITVRLTELFRRKRPEKSAPKTLQSAVPRLVDLQRMAAAVSVSVETRNGPSSRPPARMPSRPPESSRDPRPDSSRDARPDSSRESPRDARPDSSRESPREPRSDSSHDSSRESATSPLFDQVLALSGLPVFIGKSSLKRALERAGVDVASLMPESLHRALPEIQQTLNIYFPGPEAERHVAAIAALARRPS